MIEKVAIRFTERFPGKHNKSTANLNMKLKRIIWEREMVTGRQTG